MNQWSEYRGHPLLTDDCLIDSRNDTSASTAPTLPSSAAAAVTSSCISDVTSRCLMAHSAVDLCRRPALGLKKCFHCPHCRYSTDRKNNLKRHLGTMHRDQYVAGPAELDQSKYHVSVHSTQPSVDDYAVAFHRRLLNYRRHTTDLARTGDISTTQTDDVGTYDDDADSRPVMPSRSNDVTIYKTTKTNDVNSYRSAVIKAFPPSLITTQIDDVKTHQTTPNGDVSEDCAQTLPVPLSPITDCRNSLPRFEPRPATAYRRRSSRMFFYDRLRSTHQQSDN